jgi:transposase
LIPAAKSGGRPRTMDMRAAMNAIFYLLRTGCPWRYLPRGPFPPRSTVYNIFRQFRRDGVWERIWEELHMALREALDREASPTAAILDSQSLKAAMARPRQDPPALSMAGTYLGRRRLQRPSGQGCRGQIAGAPARNRQAVWMAWRSSSAVAAEPFHIVNPQ